MLVIKTTLAAGTALLLAAALPLQAQDKSREATPGTKKETTAPKAGLSREDRNALENLAQADIAEVEAGKLGVQKATNPEVKKFAQHMVDEHTAMLKEGEKLAQAKGVKPPTSPSMKHRALLKVLEMKSGDDFDQDFMERMVKDHESALELAEKCAREAKDADLKAHAEKGAPKIKEHLAQARKIHGSLATASGSGTSGEKASGKGRK
jgi:putative membrane protein